jgi:MFS superfamily sulfate permease-like transporter
MRDPKLKPVSQFARLKENFKYDILSGFIVSLIALPLCLGVAAASNFPPITGVMTSIVAGLFAGFLSGSELAIKGPAAGLIVIVAGAVEEFGKGDLHHGYLLTASLIAVTGLAQVALGIVKIGRWADFIPSSVVHGMLAAIGIIIISKQIHLLIGITPAEIKGMQPVELISHIPESLTHLEWHITLIGVFSLALLFLLPRIKNPLIKAIPPFLIVICFAIIIAQAFHFSGEKIFYNALINPGKIEINFFFDAEIFNSENLGVTMKYFFLLTIIGTIESILTVKAVDLLDPRKRVSDYNRDVIAVGLGNIVTGLLGALPMISEVARSSANINNKGTSRLSAIMHGVFLTIFVLIFVSVIKLIPVAALSSILIFVGIKLANPKDFIKAFKISNEHFVVFLSTAVVTICVDLLVGVVTGLALKLIINIVRSGEFKRIFKTGMRVETSVRQSVIYLDAVATFTNWLPLKKVLGKENGKRIVVDFTNVKVVDSAFIDNITRYKEYYEGEFILRGFQELQPLKEHSHSMRIRSSEERTLKIHLSDHQRRLKEYCEKHNFILSLGTVIPSNYLEGFKSFKHSVLRQTKVYIVGSCEGVKFEYIEGLMYDPVDMIEYHINIFGIESTDSVMPKFMMQRESKLDTVIEFLMKNQLVFENNPVFNSMYSVYTRDKEQVARLLNTKLISFFETHDIRDSVIEGDGERKIIIYNNHKEPGILLFEYNLKTASALCNRMKTAKSDREELNLN